MIVGMGDIVKNCGVQDYRNNWPIIHIPYGR